jgi:DNA invertase Pin-like site-specific DNA recombinase
VTRAQLHRSAEIDARAQACGYVDNASKSVAPHIHRAQQQPQNFLQTFDEVETGKGADALDRRPQLAAALKAAKQIKAPIIVAKLCRLSRDVHFISGLMSCAHRSMATWVSG